MDDQDDSDEPDDPDDPDFTVSERSPEKRITPSGASKKSLVPVARGRESITQKSKVKIV